MWSWQNWHRVGTVADCNEFERMQAVNTAASDPDRMPVYDSTAGLIFDIIKEDDPSSFVCLHDQGRATRQMWDKRKNNEFNLNVFLFDAYYADGITFEVHVNPEFENSEAAMIEAFRYVNSLGQLPTIFRKGIRSLGVHDGNKGASAGAGKMFVYKDNAIYRQSYKHLEETLLHESVHASLDKRYMRDDDWRAAQIADNRFVTDYARRGYPREDMAETALLAWGILRYPGRIPPVDTADIKNAVPNRIAFLAGLLPIDGPLFDIPDTGAVTLADAPDGCVATPPV